jgi:acetophenone carboxylase
MDYAVKIHAVPSAALGTWGFGSKITLSQGLFGGYGVPALPFLAISKSNMNELLRHTDVNVPNSARMLYHEQAVKGRYTLRGYPCVAEPTKEGDLVAGGTGGGGGYGDPIERDPTRVMKDLEVGAISPWAAKNVYKVVYDEKRLAVDEEKTKALREQEMRDRKTRGKKYGEFEKEWLKKKPGDETLEFYGAWPTPRYESFSYFGDWSGYEEK